MLNLTEKADSYDQLDKNISRGIYLGEFDYSHIKISIVIPTFRRSDLLFETVRSCREIYNNSNFEIVVVFNAQGETKELIQYIDENKIKNISVYENINNIGMFQNWNQGIRLAKAEWISIMHDDDMFAPCFFELALETLCKVKRDTAYVNFNGQVVGNEKFEEISAKTIEKLCFVQATIRDVKILGVSPFFATTCGTLINKRALEKVGGFDVATYPSGDVLLPLKLINNGYKCFICKDKINYYRKQVNASIRKEVMDAFIYFYGELQKTVYGQLCWFERVIYSEMKKCLYFKAVWHVFLQAENRGVQLDSSKPEIQIQNSIRYRIMDVIQRMYWRNKRIRLTIIKRSE